MVQSESLEEHFKHADFQIRQLRFKGQFCVIPCLKKKKKSSNTELHEEERNHPKSHYSETTIINIW